MSLSSSRKKANVSGEVQIKVGLLDPSQPDASKEELQEKWEKFSRIIRREGSDVVQSPMNTSGTDSPGIGMVHSTDEFEEEVTSSEAEEGIDRKKHRAKPEELRRKIKKSFAFNQAANDVLGVVFMEVQAVKDLPPERNGKV